MKSAVSIVAIGVGSFFVADAARGDVVDSFRTHVQPVLAAKCVSCHGGDKPEAKLDLSQPAALEGLAGDRWFRVRERIADGSMPPEGEPALSDAERTAVTDWIRGDLTEHLVGFQRREGRSKLRRLT